MTASEHGDRWAKFNQLVRDLDNDELARLIEVATREQADRLRSRTRELEDLTEADDEMN